MLASFPHALCVAVTPPKSRRDCRLFGCKLSSLRDEWNCVVRTHARACTHDSANQYPSHLSARRVKIFGLDFGALRLAVPLFTTRRAFSTYQASNVGGLCAPIVTNCAWFWAMAVCQLVCHRSRFFLELRWLVAGMVRLRWQFLLLLYWMVWFAPRRVLFVMLFPHRRRIHMA